MIFPVAGTRPNINNYILHLCCSKFAQKVVPILHSPTTKYMCTLLWSILQVKGSVRAKSGGWWSHSAGSRSPQKLLCTKSSMHEISVIKIRWSLTTDIVNSSFYRNAWNSTFHVPTVQHLRRLSSSWKRLSTVQLVQQAYRGRFNKFPQFQQGCRK